MRTEGFTSMELSLFRAIELILVTEHFKTTTYLFKVSIERNFCQNPDRFLVYERAFFGLQC